MLILIGGPDRVGKSTLANELSILSGIPVKHHNEPCPNDSSIFDVYLREAREGINQIWDRSYLCAYVLERQRKRTHDHLVDIIDLEMELSKLHEVIHVGVTRSWNWSAPLHIDELDQAYGGYSSWYRRDVLMARQEEHHFYINEMENFYRYVTMFPSFMLEPEWGAEEVLNNVKAISKSERPRFRLS
jgi:hypothetical protein